MKRSYAAYVSMLVLLLAAAGASVALARHRPDPLRKDFSTFPAQIGAWRSTPLPDPDERTLKIMGVSDFLNRVYYRDGVQVSFYVGYYRSQRAGESIHSPKNCLPGSGFEVLDTHYGTLGVPAAARSIPVNFYRLQKDQEQMFVLYWYETHGRVYANEYLGKAIMVWEAARSGRTDGALVRLTASGPSAQAQAATEELARSVFPILRAYLAD